MPTVEGSVSLIHIVTDYCCVTIDRPGRSDTVLLWSYYSQPDNAANRLLHANYLALTRDAFIHSKTLSVEHPEDSALVTAVTVMG